MRKLLPFILLLVVIGSIGYGGFRMNQRSESQLSTIQAIPTSAIMVWNSNEWNEVWSQLSQGNLIWDTLQADSQLAQFSLLIEHLDTTIFTRAQHSSAFVFSLHHNLKGDWFIAANAESLDLETIANDSSNVFEQTSFSIAKGYMESTWSTPLGEVYGAVQNNLLLLSSSPALIATSIEQLENQSSLLDNPVFKKAWESRGVNELANCLVHFPSLVVPIEGYLKSGPQADAQAFKYWSDWASLDAILKVNGVLLDGWNYSQDSLSRFLHTFDNQKPIRLHCFEVLPERTSALIHFSFSDFSSWHPRYLEYIEQTGQMDKYKARMAALTDQGMTDPNLFLDWIEGEVATGWFRPRFSRDEITPFVLIRSYNSDLGWNRLEAIAGDSAKRSEYKGYKIIDLGYTHLTYAFFGELFNDVSGTYITEINDFFYIANSEKDLKEIIDAYEKEETLEKNERFEILADNIYDESNMMILARARHALPLIESLFKSEENTPLIKHTDIVRGFEGIITQVAVDAPGRYYQHVYLNYNPRFKEQVLTVWEASLDTTLQGDIHIFQNHYTGRYELFVQDANNMCYLIGSTGKVLWSKQLDGAIMGSISMVDVYSNKKYQILTNTEKTVYLIDRKGRNVSGFPIKLTSKAVAQHSAIQYEKGSKIRIFVPLRNGTVLNLNGDGEAVRGWEQDQGSTGITHPIKHFVLSKKDYITLLNRDGVLQGVGRRGKTRLRLNHRLPIADGVDYWLDKSTTLGRSGIVFADSSGNMITQYFDNKVEKVKAAGPSLPAWFTPIDVDNDKSWEYIFADSNMITLADHQGKKMAEFEYEMNSAPRVYPFSTGSKIGFSTTDGFIHLIDRNGNEHPGFPYPGAGVFKIQDLDLDGTKNIIVSGADGAILVYPLNE